MSRPVSDTGKAFKQYKETGSLEARNALIQHYIASVQKITYKLMMVVGNEVEYEDLFNYGVVILIEIIDTQAKKYDMLRLGTYICQSTQKRMIQILKEVYGYDPEIIMYRLKCYNDTKNKLEEKLNRKVSHDEVINAIHSSYNDIGLKVEQHNEQYLRQDMLKEQNRYSLEHIAISNEFKRELGKAIRTMKPTYRDILKMYFCDGVSLARIAKKYGVTPYAIDLKIRRALSLLENPDYTSRHNPKARDISVEYMKDMMKYYDSV